MNALKATITIEGDRPLTTFVQTWTTKSLSDQESLLEVMHRRAFALTGQPGFVSLSIHRSRDGKQVAVYAQWRSEGELLAAVGSAAAKAGHAELVQWGAPDGGATYAVAEFFGPSVNGGGMNTVPDPKDAMLTRAQERWAARGFRTRIVRVNGVSLHVCEAGEGEAVFLLHGYPQSGEAWRLVAPELAKTHHVVVPDLRGMGLSEATETGYDLETVAEDIHELAAALSISSVKVVGHDWGASVGAVYAARQRAEVTKLAFLESALPGAGFEVLWNFSTRNDLLTFIPFLLMGEGDAVGDTTAQLMAGNESEYLHHLWASFTGDRDAAPFTGWAPYVEALSRPGISASTSRYYRSAYRSAEQVKAWIAQKVEVPVLAIAGERGIGQHQEPLVRAFASNVRGSLIVPGAGHFLPEERPLEISSALTAFLSS